VNADPAGQSAPSLRLLYWSARDERPDPALESILANSKPDEECSLQRIPTSLDPSLCYQELRLRPLFPTHETSDLTLLSAPADPDLAPVRMRLLDGVDALVWTLATGHRASAQNLQALAEIRSALRAYGRELEEVPLFIQLTGAMDSSNDAIARVLPQLQTEPHAILRVDKPESYKETLETITRLARAQESRPLDSGLSTRFESRKETMPISPIAPALSPPPAEEITALLEESILAEAEDAGFDDFFDESDLPSPLVETGGADYARAQVEADLEIVSVGKATASGKRGVRLPLTLSGPSGDSVPLTLRIELESGPGERKN
jgi:hypothetical protein